MQVSSQALPARAISGWIGPGRANRRAGRGVKLRRKVDGMQTRRDFLKALALAAPAGNCASKLYGLAQQVSPASERFLFGADVYPDIQSAELNKSMLDLLHRA